MRRPGGRSNGARWAAVAAALAVVPLPATALAGLPASAAPAPAAVVPAATKVAPRPAYGYAALSGAGLSTSRGLEVTWSANPQVPFIEANGPGSPPTFTARSFIGDAWSTINAYDPGFRGGITIAACAKEDGGRGLVTGPGAGGGPHIRRFHIDGTYQPTGGGFFAYDGSFGGGVYVACADLDGDGSDEIITGPGAGGGPNVRVFSQSGNLKASFFAEDPAFKGGIRVAAIPASNGQPGRIVTAAGQGGGPAVRTFTPGGQEVNGVFCFDPGYNGGVTVAAGDVDGDGTVDIVCGSASGTSNIVFRTATLAQHPTLEGLFAKPGGANSNGIRVAVPPRLAAKERNAVPVGLFVGSGPSSTAGAAVQTFIGAPLAAEPTRAIVGGHLAHANGTVEPYGPPGGGLRFSPDHSRVVGRLRESGVFTADADGGNVRELAVQSYDGVQWIGNDLIVPYTTVTAMAPDGTNRRSPAGPLRNVLSTSPDGKLALLGSDSAMGVWRTANNGETPTPRTVVGAVATGAIANDGTVYLCNGDGHLSRQTATGQREVLANFTSCRSMELSPDGRYLAYVQYTTNNNQVLVYKLALLDLLTGTTTTLVPEGVRRFAWSPDSSAILVGLLDNDANPRFFARGYRPAGTTFEFTPQLDPAASSESYEW